MALRGSSAGDGLNQRVCIGTDEEKGRCLFAEGDIRAGEVIFEEHPFVCCQLSWNRIHNFQACDHCLTPLQSAEKAARHLCHDDDVTLPHAQGCCEVKPQHHVCCHRCLMEYCSEECRAAAERTYHRAICQGDHRLNPAHPINVLDNKWRELTGPKEDQSILLLVRLIGLIKQSSDKAAVIEAVNKFCSGTSAHVQEHRVMKMMGPQYKEMLIELHSAWSQCEQQDESVSQWFTMDGFCSLLSLIARNGQGIGTSSISVWVSNCEKLPLAEREKAEMSAFIDKLYEKMAAEVGSLLNCEGVGLYQLQSLCNHSCSSNGEISFEHNDSRLTLRALTDIQHGQEITINYLDECDQHRSRHSRQKMLSEMYLFACSCERCVREADDADVTSSEDDTDDD